VTEYSRRICGPGGFAYLGAGDDDDGDGGDGGGASGLETTPSYQSRKRRYQ